MTDAPRTLGLGRVPAIALAMSLACLIVAVGYARARYNQPGATELFWLGELVLYAAPALVLLTPRPVSQTEGRGIALLLPVVTYVIMQCYSPASFRFFDELAHVQTAQSILATHHLFHQNTVLPVSPYYPALEITTTALSSLSHLNVTLSGTIVVGAAHVLLGVGIYLLVLELTNRPRIAALAAVVYAAGPQYQFFTSYFIYEAIALPFMLAALIAGAKLLKQDRWLRAGAWTLVAVAAIAVTAVSHHVTSYALIIFFLVIIIVRPFVGSVARRSWQWPFLISVFAACVGFGALWDLLVAKGTVAYFRPAVEALFHRAHSRPSPPPPPHSVSGSPPVVDTGLEYLATLLLLALVVLGLWSLWRSRGQRNSSFALPLGVASLSVFGLVLVRVVSSNGVELAGRGFTYALVPASLVCAVALRAASFSLSKYLRYRGTRRARHYVRPGAWLSYFTAAPLIVLLVVAAGDIAGGWPAPYSRLPWPFQVAAWERSVDAYNVAAAQWFADYIPPNYGVASDEMTGDVIGALGHEADVEAVAYRLFGRNFTRADYKLVSLNGIEFVVLDLRLSQQLPA
ncbi:MAG TPA: DUF6541 family protein, partial [Acidimicrobiales bacterium]|nr:DUF6541 family protein [Acidimicrobiales bacterium]